MDMERVRLWVAANEVMQHHGPALDYKGNCYEVAFRIVMDGDVPERELRGWRLCHGMVENTVNRHGHAWVECDGWAIDFSNGHAVVLPADAYRRMGKATDVQEYEWHKAAGAGCREGNFGPWHHDGGTVPLEEVDRD